MTEQIIIEVVTDFFGLREEILQTKSRRRELVDARQIIAYFCREFTRLSQYSIGKLLNLDHATVYYAVKNVNNLIVSDVNYSKNIAKMRELIAIRMDEVLKLESECFQENDFYEVKEEIKETKKELVLEPIPCTERYKRPFSEHSISGEVPVMNFKSLVR